MRTLNPLGYPHRLFKPNALSQIQSGVEDRDVRPLLQQGKQGVRVQQHPCRPLGLVRGLVFLMPSKHVSPAPKRGASGLPARRRRKVAGAARARNSFPHALSRHLKPPRNLGHANEFVRLNMYDVGAGDCGFHVADGRDHGDSKRVGFAAKVGVDHPVPLADECVVAAAVEGVQHFDRQIRHAGQNQRELELPLRHVSHLDPSEDSRPPAAGASAHDPCVFRRARCSNAASASSPVRTPELAQTWQPPTVLLQPLDSAY